MAKNVLQTMDDYYAEALRGARSNEQAFEAAAEKFTRVHGVECPMTYSGFRTQMYRKKKTRR